MKNVRFLQSIPFSICKSNFLVGLSDLDSLPQKKELNKFIKVNNIVDIAINETSNQHHTIVLVVNHQYCSLIELENKIIASSQCAEKYFYLAVNKFYVYSTVDNPEAQSEDYDLQLITYCCKIIENEFFLLNHTARNDDNGFLGNFLHPVTTMFFERYE